MNNLAVRKDYLIVSYVGLLFGLLLLPILENTKPEFWNLNIPNSASIVLGFWLFANLALFIGGWLGIRWPVIWQFVKYAAAGSSNALLSIGILNLFSAIFLIYSGGFLVVFNIIALTFAIINSYLLNKFWAFKNSVPFNWSEVARFFGLNATTLVINSTMIYFLTTIIGAPESISAPVWENISLLIATPITLIINFLGYKFVVFKV